VHQRHPTRDALSYATPERDLMLQYFARGVAAARSRQVALEGMPELPQPKAFITGL
jgi:hypothetical protein